MRHYLIIDGQSSKNKRLFISAGSSFDTAERDIELIAVAGKNGEIIGDNMRFKNIPIKYPCFTYGYDERDLQIHTREIAAWLYQFSNYVKIEDTYLPDFYRMGVPTGNIAWSTKLARAAEGELNFSCKPQLFYKSGDSVEVFNSSGVIVNPSVFSSKPNIRVNGSGAGSLTIGKYRLDFSDIPTYIDINSELVYAYKGEYNLNENVTASDKNNFMQIDGGRQVVTITGGITSVEITGKWWTV